MNAKKGRNVKFRADVMDFLLKKRENTGMPTASYLTRLIEKDNGIKFPKSYKNINK